MIFSFVRKSLFFCIRFLRFSAQWMLVEDRQLYLPGRRSSPFLTALTHRIGDRHQLAGKGADLPPGLPSFMTKDLGVVAPLPNLGPPGP